MSSHPTLRIATRESVLALWQARYVAGQLESTHSGLRTELVPMTTRGDQLLDKPLAAIGGKGLFLKELEHALLEDRADIAVHSMKDVPAEMPDGLTVPVILARHDPRDAFVSPRWDRLESLPEGARLGTSSLRRQAQLRRLRPDLVIEPLRGNVQTRLGKLDEGQFDAIILACAGLDRLDLSDRIAQRLAPSTCLPAVAQGAIGIECRSDDAAVAGLIAPLNDPRTALEVGCERAFSAALGGSCQVPLAAYGQLQDEVLHLDALVASPDGQTWVDGQRQGPPDQFETMGRSLAEELTAAGADRILAAL